MTEAKSPVDKIMTRGGRRILSIGECMVEFSDQGGGLFRLGFAGDTFNTAWYCRTLLPEDWQVDYFTTVGDDVYSAEMLDFFTAGGIGTSHIGVKPATRPGLYLIRQEGGDRHFTYWRGQSAARTLADDEAALAVATQSADVIYFSGVTLAVIGENGRINLLRALDTARRAGSLIAFDPNQRPALWLSDRLMTDAITEAAACCDWVFPTFSDEARYFGDDSPQAVAERYLRLGAREVVVKNGAGVALAATPAATASVAALSDTLVVDPTGAGDSFNAGYMAARLSGREPDAALTSAHAVAATVVGSHGAILPRHAAVGSTPT